MKPGKSVQSKMSWTICWTSLTRVLHFQARNDHLCLFQISKLYPDRCFHVSYMFILIIFFFTIRFSRIIFIVFARASAHSWISILIWWFPLATIKNLIFWRLNYEKDPLGFVKNNINTSICIIIYSLQSIITHIMSPIWTSSLNFKPLNSKPPVSEM